MKSYAIASPGGLKPIRLIRADASAKYSTRATSRPNGLNFANTSVLLVQREDGRIRGFHDVCSHLRQQG
jgi:nitrite reductase/ring-hydroxylating ferredoxin subunit